VIKKDLHPDQIAEGDDAETQSFGETLESGDASHTQPRAYVGFTGMQVGQAREVARRWAIEEASRVPGFCGAYTVGSTNWLGDDAELTATSDLDVMIVVTDMSRASGRRKFWYGDVLLEASYLGLGQFASADLVLGDYHLAPSFRTSSILLDPSGQLNALRAIVARDYAQRRWVRQRCANARDKVLRHLRSVNEGAPLHDQVMACLFGAGVTTHMLLAAGLGNPTVRTRYVAVQELLAEYDQVEFHEALLQLLGAARMSRERVSQHLATLTEIFDATAKAIKTPFPFASDLDEIARPLAIGGSLELIERGYHREAMFWIAVTHCRCQKVLSVEGQGSCRRGSATLTAI
jgi:hypothetical protein